MHHPASSAMMAFSFLIASFYAVVLALPQRETISRERNSVLDEQGCIENHLQGHAWMALQTASSGDQRRLHGDQTGPHAYPQTWPSLQGHPPWHGSASCSLALHHHWRKAVKLCLHGARGESAFLQVYVKHLDLELLLKRAIYHHSMLKHMPVPRTRYVQA